MIKLTLDFRDGQTRVCSALSNRNRKHLIRDDYLNN